MGIKIFYIVSAVYAVIAGLGIFQSLALQSKDYLGGKLLYILLAIAALCYALYMLKRKIKFYDTFVTGIISNLFIQLTGGLASPIFFLYFLILPVVAYKDTYRDYWLVAGVMLGIEVLASVFKHNFALLPASGLAAAIVILGTICKKWLDRESIIKRSLIKYETRDQFFSPADFEAKAIITSVKDIDRHQGIERPVLYFIKFIHNTFNAYSTVIFSYNNENLVLIQGFSRSELFQPDTVIDLKRGLYRQVIAEQKSVLIKEFTQNPEELGFYRGELKISSVIIAPIIILDRIEGVLVVDRKDGEFSEDEKDRLDEAGKGIGFQLAMLRLYEKERYEATYLKSIAALVKELQRGLELKSILSDTVKSFQGVLKCDDISIASMDELNEQGIVLESTYVKENTKFSFNDGLVGLIGRHKNYILKEDLGEGDFVVLKKGQKSNTGSFVGVPVFAGATVKENDELLGVIWLEDHRRKRFNEDDVKALNILASQLTLAWQRAILHERVKEQSVRDGLTGLYNHRHFQEVLEKEIAKQKELVLILFDIDHFKKINDSYGHQAGDEVLMFLGRLVAQTGINARYGGEEFAVILPGANLKKGAETAVRLKDHLKKAEIKFNQIKIKITVSIGIAHYPKDAKTRMDLIERADKALYAAKETGRDKIVIAQSLAEKTNQINKKPG